MTAFLYAFSNESMPNILKVSSTSNSIFQILEEANAPNIWNPPTPYEIALAKEVPNGADAISKVHRMLDKHYERVRAADDFFRISKDDLYDILDLVEGQWMQTDKPMRSFMRQHGIPTSHSRELNLVRIQEWCTKHCLDLILD